MLTERMGGISIVDGGKEVTIEEEIDRGDGVGKEELLGGRVYSGIYGSMFSVERGQVVHPGVAIVDGRVSGEGV